MTPVGHREAPGNLTRNSFINNKALGECMPVLLCQHGFWQPNYGPPEKPPSLPYADLCIPAQAPRQALIEAPCDVSPMTPTGVPIEAPLPALRAATLVAPAGVSTIFYPRQPIKRLA
jgi:hypothetical protein